MDTYEFTAMNTKVLLAAEGRPDRVSEGFRLVEEHVRRYERRFSRFVPESELNRLNQGGREWLEVSPELFEMLSIAGRLHVDTGGLFDPAVLPNLERIGYDRDMDQIRAEGDLAAPAAAQPVSHPPFSALRLDAALRAVFLPASMRIDLGGLAKGWIVERAAHLLGSFARACLVDAGGDMCMVGLPAGQAFWPVAIEDPLDPTRDLALLGLGEGGVATSSIAHRAWTQGGRARHHLIDPRRGEPVETEWVCVTVVMNHTATAEALAKALLIGGSELAGELMARFPSAEYIAFDRRGGLWGSPGSRDLLVDEFSFTAVMEQLL